MNICQKSFRLTSKNWKRFNKIIVPFYNIFVAELRRLLLLENNVDKKMIFPDKGVTWKDCDQKEVVWDTQFDSRDVICKSGNDFV